MMSCSRFITAHAARHPVARSCRVLGVSRSDYYAWRRRAASARAQADAALTARLTAIHRMSRGIYGSPRIHTELRATGERHGRRRVARLMRLAGLRGCHGRQRQLRTTPPDRQALPAPDRVARVFAPVLIGAPNRLWVAASSYVPTQEGGSPWRSCWMPSGGGWWAGPWPSICAPTWCWRRSAWPSGSASQRPVSSIIGVTQLLIAGRD